MAKNAVKTVYFVDRYLRCGEMPLFVIFCRNRRGQQSFCVMLCSLRRLRQLVHLRKGFSHPAEYGQVLFTGKGSEPGDTIREVLKARYDFDLDNCASNDLRFN